ncbi:MAG: hypothetical protein J6Y48_12665 [Clostridia bacterium]|nr:hypothetical protein [Clostridia bacterium]
MSDTAGYSKRIYKKKYKQAVVRIADKIPLAFKTKADRKAWISEITNKRMQDIKKNELTNNI